MENSEEKIGKGKSLDINKNKPSLQIILTIVGLGLTMVSYVIGKAFYDAYMQSFGLSSDFFPISTQDIYFYSYIAALHIFSSIIAIFHQNIVSIILSAILVIGIIVYLALRPKNKKSFLSKFPFLEKIFSSEKIQFFTQVLTTTLVGVYLITVFIYVITVILMFALYLYMGPHTLGQQLATKKIKEYQEYGCYIPKDSNANTCIQILDKDNKEVVKGVLIAYDNDKIAFLNEKGSQVIKFPIDGKIMADINMTK